WGRPAAELHRLVRVGRAWTTWRGRRLLVLGASLAPDTPGAPGTLDGVVVVTAAGGVRLELVQPEGRRPVPAEEWVRGARPAAGEALGS
ncbi:hypothetical protein ACSTIZ_00565, partial [Vibrio parahaemolyticus]